MTKTGHAQGTVLEYPDGSVKRMNVSHVKSMFPCDKVCRHNCMYLNGEEQYNQTGYKQRLGKLHY